MLYITNDNNTFIKNIIKMFIKKIFRIYKIFALIIFNRN